MTLFMLTLVSVIDYSVEKYTCECSVNFSWYFIHVYPWVHIVKMSLKLASGKSIEEISWFTFQPLKIQDGMFYLAKYFAVPATKIAGLSSLHVFFYLFVYLFFIRTFTVFLFHETSSSVKCKGERESGGGGKKVKHERDEWKKVKEKRRNKKRNGVW